MTWWRERGAIRGGMLAAWCAMAAVSVRAADAPTPAPGAPNVPPVPSVLAVPAEPAAPLASASATSAPPATAVSTNAVVPGTNAPARDAWADLADIWRRQPDADASPVENLTLPIEHYDNGRVRAVLRAGRAMLGKSDLIWSWQVVVDLYDTDGRPDGTVEAANCLYDRAGRRGYCPGDVRLVRTNATISGVGLYWSMADEHMRILSQPVVHMARPIRPAGMEGNRP